LEHCHKPSACQHAYLIQRFFQLILLAVRTAFLINHPSMTPFAAMLDDHVNEHHNLRFFLRSKHCAISLVVLDYASV